MRPYRDAFKFFLKYVGAIVIVSLLCYQLPVPEHIKGLMVLFGPWIGMYGPLVRLLKRYIAFYNSIAAIRAAVKIPYGEVKAPYSSNRRKVVQELRDIKKQDSQGSYNIG